MKRICSLILICFFLIPEISLALDETDGVPMELMATPQMTLPGMTVTISGTTVTVGNYVDVKIQIIPPKETSATGTSSSASVPINLGVKCDEHGSFSVEFTQTSVAGTYKVTAQSPVGTGIGSTTFQIQPTSIIGPVATTKFEELGQALNEYFGTLTTSIQNLPASDERDQLMALSTDMASQMNGLAQEVSKIKPQLDKMLEAMDLPSEDLADEPAMEIVNEVISWTIDSDQQIERLKSLLSKQQQAPTICDMIHTMGEGMRLASNVLAFYGKGMSVVINLAIDKGIPIYLNQISTKRSAMWDSAAKGVASATQKTAVCLAASLVCLTMRLSCIQMY